MNNDYIKEIKAILIFALISILFFGGVYVLDYYKVLYQFMFLLVVYPLLYFIIFIFNDVVIKSNTLDKILSIIGLPFHYIRILITLVLPFYFLLIHLLYYIGFIFLIPKIFIEGLSFIDITFSSSNMLYIKLTLSVFIAVLFNFQLRRLIYVISPARIKDSKKLRPYKLDKLTDYILSENNVRFVIYSLYVILLMIFNYIEFEKSDLANLEFNRVILQSFVTFIAFDRALTLLKSLEFKPSDLLQKIIQSIANKLKEEHRNNRDKN